MGVGFYDFLGLSGGGDWGGWEVFWVALQGATVVLGSLKRQALLDGGRWGGEWCVWCVPDPVGGVSPIGWRAAFQGAWHRE